MTATIEAPSTNQLDQKIGSLVEQARELKIANAFDFEQAGDQLKTIKGMMKEVESTFKPMKQKADEAKRSILDQEKRHLGPLATAENYVKRAMLTYQQEEQKKADDERRRLQAIADENTRKEREAALKKAESAKKPETKAKYEEQAAMVQAPVIQVPVEAPKVAGISTRKVWKARVVDAAAIPREYLLVDEKKLQQLATMMKEQAALPGVQFYFEEVMSAGSR